MRRAALAALLVAGLPVAVLAVEVQIARGGPRLDEVELTFPVGDPGAPLAVWLGDSTAAGVGVTEAADAVAVLVARRLDERVAVLARSGATVAEVVDEQLPDVAALAPARVYVSVGANDVTHLTSRAAFRRSYRRLVDGLPTGTEIVLLGIPDMGAAARIPQPLRAIAAWRGRALDDEIAELARERNLVHVPIAARTGPAFRRDPDRYLAADRYHPSDDGYRLWSDVVVEAVR